MSKNNQGKRRGYRDPTPARGNRIRVRGKRLDQVDEDKIGSPVVLGVTYAA